MNQRTVHSMWLMGLLLGLTACGDMGHGQAGEISAAEAPAAKASTPDAVSTPLHSERGGIGLELSAPGSDLVSAQSAVVDSRRSLVVTEKSILSQFTLAEVFDRLKAQNGDTGYSATQLFRQLWDTQNPAPGEADLPGEAHCTDTGGTLNGFAYDCRTGEGAQASSTARSTITSYSAVGLFNRFDLAASDGADCGEYRIVFAKTDGTPGRNFIIWEAVLPNPSPSKGIEGCRPVAQFWVDLSADADPASRATKLKSFYFTGLPGFLPVVHMENYGNNSRGTGQVRTNQFIDFPWMLREFKLQRACPSTGCTLRFVPTTVKTNPFGGLFDPTRTDALARDFQSTFVAQVPNLAINDINKFFYVVSDQFNAGQSADRSSPDSYVSQFGKQNPSIFRTNIENKLTSIGSTLTPEQVVARAQTQSCIGCHQHSNGTNIGGGLVWPSSTGFVHSTEFPDSADSTRFGLSKALVDVFLPQRKSVLEKFINTPTRGAAFVGQSVPTRVPAGSVFTIQVTMKNTGTEAWTASGSFRLGSQAPQDNVTWGFKRIQLESNEVVHLGQEKTFSFKVTAPITPGTYAFRWRMVQESVEWFGDFSPEVAIQVDDALSEKSIATGGYHAAALKVDGTVWTWGYNGHGQLGDGTTTSRSSAVQVNALSEAHNVAAGYTHTVALKVDGTVWAWGSNHYGQLGNGTMPNHAAPVQALGISGVIAIAAGGYHTVALKHDGTVWAWGGNYSGQLGDGTTTSRSNPARISGLSGVVAISAGYSYTMALKNDGTVWAWGDNHYGQLGDGTTTNRATPVRVLGLSDISSIAAGGLHAMGVKSDGTVWAWGFNYRGQLGDGTTTNRTTPVQVLSLSFVKSVAAGWHHSTAVMSDGTVWAWGYNLFGQLGDGTTSSRKTPVQVLGLSGIKAVVAGMHHTLSLKNGGTTWAWGYNLYGQLSDGTTTERSTAAQVQAHVPVNALPTGTLLEIPTVSDGVSGKGPPNTAELVTTFTSTTEADCGGPNRYCADVLLRSFYTLDLKSVHAEILSMNPATGFEAYNSDPVPDPTVSNHYGLWSYGTLVASGGNATRRWGFKNPGGNFTYRGRVLAQLVPRP